MRDMELRPYQGVSIEALRAGIRAGARRQVLASPTGSGKTEMGIKLIQDATKKGRRVWFICDRVALIDQTSDRFAGYGIDHGVIQAKNPLYDMSKGVQIASAQTIARRTFLEKDLPDLIIWDECHAVYKKVLDLVAKAEFAKVVGLSATPFTAGMADHWDGLVNSTTVNQLLADKWLAPLKIKACVTPDMKGAKKKFTGEYADDDAGERGIRIIGDVVQTWSSQTRKYFGGPVKTIVFSPSVRHGQELCDQFARAGYNFQQISYLDGDDDDRRAKIEEFRKPDSAIDGLVSCAVLTKGFDVPDVRCGISCRPYRKSFSSHIQEMGRVMRIAPGKEFGLWLDHSGNCISFADDTAWFFEYGVDSLSSAQKKDSEVREPAEKIKRDRFCGDCGSLMAPGEGVCSDCGWERPRRGEIEVVQGELIDFAHTTTGAFKPRDGLRAECLKDPKAVWNAALAYCFANSSHGGPEKARKWAFGIWAGIYPGSKLPKGLYDAPCTHSLVTLVQYSLIEREVARFRKKRRAA